MFLQVRGDSDIMIGHGRNIPYLSLVHLARQLVNFWFRCPEKIRSYVGVVSADFDDSTTVEELRVPVFHGFRITETGVHHAEIQSGFV